MSTGGCSRCSSTVTVWANLLRDHDKILPQFVNDLVNAARMPPHNKVPPAVAMELLVWFARIHPRAFTSALKILSWEQMCDLVRRAGMLGLRAS